ncbi:MAG: SDR family NAD(P)-dependent oxidoreductase [Pseudomonadota bacterium]
MPLEGCISLISRDGLIAVTGASGFIGSALCATLRQQGYRVRALVRRPEHSPQLAEWGVDILRGDVADAPQVAALVANSQAVVHCAGVVRGRCQHDFDRVNVDGTQRLVDAISSAPVTPRLLLVSSLAAREPDLSWYAASKAASEAILRAQTGIPWLIIRPPAVYGPGDKEMLPIFQAMEKGIAPVPGAVTQRTSLIHITDLVKAMIASLQSDIAVHQVFSLCDDRENGYSWTEMADIAAAVYGRKVRLWRVPAWLLNSIATLNVQLARLSKRAPMLTPAKLRELRHPDWVVDNHLITQLTGWTPRIGLEKGLISLSQAHRVS